MLGDPNIAYLLILLSLVVALGLGELHTGSGGLAAAALVALVVGSLIFYSLHVSLALILLLAFVCAVFLIVVVRASLRARRLTVKTGVPVLFGHDGVATSELAPFGTVRVGGEAWSAESVAGPVRPGSHVTVIGASGVTLHVVHSDDEEGDARWTRSSPTSS